MKHLQGIFNIITEENIKTLHNTLNALEIKNINGERTFKVIASTEDMDRDGEIIKADGWDYTNFLKNPVIIANHTYNIENIVGKATKIEVAD